MAAMPTRFITPRATPRVRRTRCRNSQRTPSTMSVRIDVSARSRSGRNDPRRLSTSTAAIANDAASRKKGADTATANSQAPSGGPRNWFAVIWAPSSAPFARSRSRSSTTLGRIACEALSNTVSAIPSENATMTSRGIDSASVTIATPRSTIAAKRNVSTTPIVRRRSVRSAIAPPTREKRSHGSVPAAATSATTTGELDRDAARRGSAARTTPSPTFETAPAVHRRRKFPPHHRCRIARRLLAGVPG